MSRRYELRSPLPIGGKPIKTLHFAASDDEEEDRDEEDCAGLALRRKSKPPPLRPFQGFGHSGGLTPATTTTGDHTPLGHLDTSATLWDSGLGSPTPASSPKTGRKLLPRGSSRVGAAGAQGLTMSPIPFGYDTDDDDDDPAAVGDANARAPTPDTPPHRRMRSLRLYDTPHTPKSLFQKSQRRFCRASRSGGCRTPGSGGGPDTPQQVTSSSDGVRERPAKHGLDPLGPQANVNPFTAISPFLLKTSSAGMKRGRHDLDGLVFGLFNR